MSSSSCLQSPPSGSVHEEVAGSFRKLRPRDDYNRRNEGIPGWMVILLGAAILSLLIYVILVNGIYNNIEDPQFRVDSVVVSPLNFTNNNEITANWTIGIAVRNSCEHLSVVFENLEVSVFYKNTELLSETRVDQPFREEPGNQRKLILHPKAWLRGLSHSVADTIADDKTDGVIDFDLKVRANSTYLRRGLGGGREARMFNVLCEKLRVEYSANASHGRMLEGSRICSVR